MLAVDQCNSRWGRGTLVLAASASIPASSLRSNPVANRLVPGDRSQPALRLAMGLPLAFFSGATILPPPRSASIKLTKLPVERGATVAIHCGGA
jgi:hypothetical protein